MLTFGGLVAHAIACFAFAALGVVSLRRDAEVREGEGGGAGVWLRLAAFLTAGWAFLYLLAARGSELAAHLLSPLETLRTAGWIVFVVVLLLQAAPAEARVRTPARVAVVLGGVVALQLGLDALLRPALSGGDPWPGAQLLFLFARLAVAIGGLLLVHNLYVNTAPSSRWSIRFLCIGLAGLFGYDLNYYTLALLGGTPSADLFNMRGLANALVAPLVAVSAMRTRQFRLQLSRQVAFQTFSLAGIGAYLILMSVLGYALRQFGGDWGRLLQTAVIFSMLLLAAVVLLSGRFRAWALVQINKHFFAYKYDYREEWLRFIATISQTNATAGPLRVRAVQAVCEIISSPAGVLFAEDEDGGFHAAARWNQLEVEGSVPPGDPVAARMAASGRIVDLDELRDQRGDGAGLAPPAWAADRRAWLIVPLVHLDRLIGFILTARSLAPRTLNWEDYDLLRTAGRQAASYIAEAGSQLALIEARKFDEFNRRFAFIMHDIKNVASQLGLVARNAERHADNPEFRADMIDTLKTSVKRMNDLLARLGERQSDRGGRAAPVALAPLLAAATRRKAALHPALVFECSAPDISVSVDAERLEQAVEHLVQNAIDASAEGQPIAVRLSAPAPDTARIEVSDRGCGMSADFIRDELFNPFHSTKAGGFGIGAYEAREIVRNAGGRLHVRSRVGEGTTFTISLPAISAADASEAA